MKKIYIIIILIPVLLLGYIIIETLFFLSLDKAYELKINIIAENFCPQWKNYKIDYNFTGDGEKALKLYALISKNVIEQNQLSSYLECCDHLSLNCSKKLFKDPFGNISQIVIVDINNSGDWRYIDFFNSEEYVTSEFLNNRFSEV